ncbi:3'(2'),5'-bisphosphate nucleotidase CysQ [Caulobacter sp. BP25]|uniref:3'(2'),5'-bisphosphate nucleotidase CysQ n=1 Tax=Caulobacter sp. BP25 TaxID=2048900 RepID=UPI000C12DD3B|nr:3'(2'),5'-bisphosphate nucleotidase CysQ [Caulobacter sp. BP25]PHY18952.1 3'(2'),5'-bisphosphate nucleotidase CysQ [Caulobacter sp. BP25]
MNDLDLILDAARKAGELALTARESGLKIWSKIGGSPVTDADLAVDTLLKLELKSARPDYGWLSEETADDPTRLNTRRQFVVDPIDGTVAFMKNKPWFAVSIAVVEDGRPIAGVVHAPALSETYAATLEGPATLNGAAIAPSATDQLLGAAMLGDAKMFAHPAWREPWPQMRIESRNSIAYRMCLVASGAFDAAVALSPKSEWDLAAADLIVRRAGATLSDHKGNDFAYNRPVPQVPSLVCANQALAPLILNRVGHIELP